MREIVAVLRKNKLRTFLTGFSIAWGILMFIILIGLGNGVRNGVEKQMEGWASDAVIIYGGWASMPYEGRPANRRIYLDYNLYDYLENSFPEIRNLSASLEYYGRTVSYGNNFMSADLESATAGKQHIFNFKVKEGGRFINEIDQRESRKVIMLSEEHQRVLFKGADPVGEYVTINDVAYQVVGVYTGGWYRNQNIAFIPLSTMNLLYDRRWGFSAIEFTVPHLASIEESQAYSEYLRGRLAEFIGFDPRDQSAVYIDNNIENVLMARKAFGMINLFLGLVGLASMIAGIVGVGNIMYVTVRERTREIGIRKAIGASPWSVIRLVLSEALFLTLTAGYAGILLGVGGLKIIARMADKGSGEVALLLNPSIDLWVVLVATLLLVAAGLVAGFIPARKAAKIKPVEAMRAE